MKLINVLIVVKRYITLCLKVTFNITVASDASINVEKNHVHPPPPPSPPPAQIASSDSISVDYPSTRNIR